MKTAMQQLIEHIQNNATKFSLMNTYNILKEIEPYLEKEKEQIIEAVNYGNKQDHYDATEVELSKYYYNETFNQNK